MMMYCSMLLKGYRRPVTREDLWSLKPEDKCNEVYHAFEKNWQREMAKSNRYTSFLNSAAGNIKDRGLRTLICSLQ